MEGVAFASFAGLLAERWPGFAMRAWSCWILGMELGAKSVMCENRDY